MTHPSEESIRAACEEAGIKYEVYLDCAVKESVICRLIEALARRIEAEREA
jgi:hypothetical protein